MTKKIDGLEIVSRNAERGSAEYIYKGVYISKWTLNRGHKGRTRGSYVSAGAYFTFQVQSYDSKAVTKSYYFTNKNRKLQDAIDAVNVYVNRADVIIENGKVIINPQEREIIVQQKVNA